MDSEEKNSVSKGTEGFLDDGGESVAVGAEPEEEATEEKKGSDAPAGSEKKDDEPTPGEEEKGGKKDGDEEPPPEGDDEEVPDDKLPRGVIKRLDKMRRKQGDAEREAERLRTENESLKRTQQQQKDIGDKPDPSSFDSEAEYIDALTDWKIAKASAERERKDEERRQQENQEREQRDAQERHRETQRQLKDATKKYPDFAEVVYREDLPITQAMLDILTRFENMADVSYYLGKHPDQCADISRSGPADQALTLKDISDTIRAKERKTTKAPPPRRPIQSTGAGIKDLESMSYPEYCRAREKAEKAARGG
jgi:vacuolar-type H+-ATPase subunit I/STV1